MEKSNIDVDSFVLTKLDIEFIEVVEHFLKNPVEKEKQIHGVAGMMNKMGQKEKSELINTVVIPDIKHFKARNYHYTFSPILCQSAKLIYEKNAKSKKDQIVTINSESKNSFKINDSQFEVIFDEGNSGLAYFLSRYYDELQKDKNKSNVLKNDKFIYLGIYTDVNEEDDDDSKRVVIFSEVAEQEAFINIFHYKTLYESFVRFDLEKKKYFMLSETRRIMQALNFELLHPLMFCIILSFDENKFSSGVTFRNFVEQVFKLRDEEVQKDHLKNMFKTYFNLHNQDFISLEALTKIFQSIEEDKKSDYDILNKIISELGTNTKIPLDKFIDYWVE